MTIGDTVRVSLTEDAWHEIDPCRRLVHAAKQYEELPAGIPFVERQRPIDRLQKRAVQMPRTAGMHRDGTVIVSVSEQELASPDIFTQLGCSVKDGRPSLEASSADSIVLAALPGPGEAKRHLAMLREAGIGVFCRAPCAGTEAPCSRPMPDGSVKAAAEAGIVEIVTLEEASARQKQRAQQEKFTLGIAKIGPPPAAVLVATDSEEQWKALCDLQPPLIFFKPSADKVHAARRFFDWIKHSQLAAPVILNFLYSCPKEDAVIEASAECGALLCDGLGDGVWLEGPHGPQWLRQLGFGILQAARMRMSKTDFISCPSCGRTLFDLQDVTRRIRSRTAHLPGVKIAIMGCIVNGPGEMADADFGYVGSKPGMIDLYVGKTCVERGVGFAEADDRLIALIKTHGRWTEGVGCH